MLKTLFKIFALIAAVFAAIAGLAYWNKVKGTEYIEIYSDDDDEEF